MKLSVVITTYKRPEKLDLTLQSIRQQTRQPDQLIIADDCSPDNTAEVARKWRQEFRNFVYCRQSRNLNMPGNLNAGLALARGEYVANLHHADTYDPQLLEKWEAALDKYPTAGFVFCGATNRFENPPRPATIHLHDIEPLTDGIQFFTRIYVGSLSGPVWGTVMARRSAYEALGPFDAQFGPWSDVDMWMRMCGRYDVAYVREPLMHLDMKPSPWRGFTWNKNFLHDKMVTINIQRIFTDQPDLLKKHLLAQRNHFRLRYWRSLIGRFLKGDMAQFFEGVSLFRVIQFTPPDKEMVERSVWRSWA